MSALKSRKVKVGVVVVGFLGPNGVDNRDLPGADRSDRGATLWGSANHHGHEDSIHKPSSGGASGLRVQVEEVGYH